MKTRTRLLALLAITTATFAPSLFAQLTIPSDGSDGALIITSNTVIDLSRAVTGAWDVSNTNNAGKGIYDSNKWAVVFKYSSVTIASNTTVTFSNHPSRAPVVWLVAGNVAINGTLSLDGQVYVPSPGLTEPGPGGFRGGAGYLASGVNSSPGFGPGGGDYNASGADGNGASGSYGSLGYRGIATYGNPSLIPLIGGSGAAGAQRSDYRYSQGGGGGAILIAAGGNLSIGGTVRANGGDGANRSGSGGGVRLVANTLSGNGIVQCLGGYIGGNNNGGLGRIRLERVSNLGTIQANPDPSVVPLQAGDTPLIWLPTNGPSVRVVSIGGVTPPLDPRAAFGADGADVSLAQTNLLRVLVETSNVESASLVKIRVISRSAGDYIREADAVIESVISSSPLVIRWTNSLPVNDGYSAVQARVIRP